MNHLNDKQRSGVELAVMGGSRRGPVVAEYLLSKKCEINMFGRNLLHEACLRGYAKVATLVLARGVNPDEVGNFMILTLLLLSLSLSLCSSLALSFLFFSLSLSSTPSLYLFFSLSRPLFFFLVSPSLPLSLSTSQSPHSASSHYMSLSIRPFSPLFSPSRKSICPKVDDRNTTALHEAVRANSKECVLLLIDAGADKNIQDADGNTPMHIAAIDDCPQALEVLVEYAADGLLQNNEGE